MDSEEKNTQDRAEAEEQSEKKKKEKAPEKSRPAHTHHGHRERMRNRFLKSGLDAFESHEILELLLFYALPRVNTNPIGHELIREFHSLSGVLDADIQDLKQIKGISENAAVFLKLIPQVARQYQLDRLRERRTLDTDTKIREYVQAKLGFHTEERLLLLCLGEYLQLLDCVEIAVGTENNVSFDIRQIVECAVRRHSTRIILAHNHPYGNAEFSDMDLFTTNSLKDALGGVHIQLLDHLVVGKQGDVISMRQLLDWE